MPERAKSPSREKKLAAALKENLHRRKAQARARAQAGAGAAAASATAAPPEGPKDAGNGS